MVVFSLPVTTQVPRQDRKPGGAFQFNQRLCPMQAVPAFSVSLPHMSAINSSVAVDAAGWGLRPLYVGALEVGVPAHLAALLARLDGVEPQQERAKAVEGMREAARTFVVAIAASLGPSGIVVSLYVLCG
jgi:hypothetical protein